MHRPGFRGIGQRTRLLVASLLLLCNAAASARTIGALKFSACDVPVPHGAGYRAECASLRVAENPAQPQGRKIDLRIVLVPARTSQPKADPVVFLAGGPGQSAVEAFPMILPALAPLARTRHLLLVDQRGTGGSNRLACAMPETGRLFELTPAVARIQAADCLRAIGDRADPAFYTTSDYIRDLEAVRAALGGPSFNLIGGSYGTRVALEYLRRHGPAIRSVVIDSVVPPELALLQDHARNLDDAIARTFDLCRKDRACFARFGDPAQTLAALRERARRAPQRLRFVDPLSFAWREEPFNEAALAGVLRFFSYQPESASLLPLLLDEARAGRPEPLLAQLTRFAELADQLAHGMELSVVCAEDADLLREDPADAARLIGSAFIGFVKAQCGIWPRGARPPDFKQPVVSDRPVLILSGELDPVTPPRYGEQVRRTLANARHLIARGQGHLVMTRGCLPRLVRQFVDEGSTAALDAACLDTLGYTPAFVSYQGPGP